MTAPRYSRDELARLEKVLREIADHADRGYVGDLDETDPADLRQAADFLAETVGVLDKQRRRRQRQAAQRALNRKRKGRR